MSITFVGQFLPCCSFPPDPSGELMIGGLVLGSAYLAACIFSIPAILLGKGRLWALKALNWGLVVLVVATLLVSLLTTFPSSSRPLVQGEGDEEERKMER
jgi:hypothetical protein